MTIFMIYPKVVAPLQPWAEISQRLRRIFQTEAHSIRHASATHNVHVRIRDG